MADLSNSEDLGGVTVHIAVDASALKAGAIQAKELATQIAATPATLRIIADSSAAKVAIGNVSQVAAQTMQQVSASVSATVLKPRFDLGEQAVRDRMAAIIRSMREQAANANINIQAKTRLFGEPSERRAAQQSTASIVRDEIRMATNGGDDEAGGSGRGGRGWGSRNLLSARGLGGITPGGLTAVFAALEAIKVEAAYVAADDTARNYRSVLRDRQQVGAYSAINDPDSLLDAKKMASAQSDQMKQEAWNNTPLIGAITGLVDAIKGTTERDKSTAEIYQRAIESNEKAAASVAIERAQIGQIETGHSYQAVFDETRAQEMQRARAYEDNASAQTKADYVDSLKLGILKQRQAQADDDYADNARLTAGANAVLEGAAIKSARQGDNRNSLIYRQGERVNALDDRHAKEAAADVNLDGPDRAVAVFRRKQETLNLKETNNQELLDLDKKTQAQITAIESEGASDRIRISKGEHAAKDFDLRQSVAAQIAAAPVATKIATAISGASRLFANFIDNQRAAQDDVRDTVATVKSAEFRLANDNQQAAVTDLLAGNAARLESVRRNYGEDSQQYRDEQNRGGASLAALRHDQAQANESQSTSIDAHIAGNALRAVFKDQQAAILEADAAGIASIKAASPEMRAKVAQGVISDMETAQKRLSYGGAPGVAQSISAGEAFTLIGRGDPGGAAGQLSLDIAKARKVAVTPSSRSLPGDGSNNGSSGGGVGDLIGKGNDLLQKIYDALHGNANASAYAP